MNFAVIESRNEFLISGAFFFRLDLDKWINDPPSESSEEEEEIDAIFDTPNEHKYDLRQLSKFSIIRQLYKMKVFSGSKLILV